MQITLIRDRPVSAWWTYAGQHAGVVWFTYGVYPSMFCMLAVWRDHPIYGSEVTHSMKTLLCNPVAYVFSMWSTHSASLCGSDLGVRLWCICGIPLPHACKWESEATRYCGRLCESLSTYQPGIGVYGHEVQYAD